MTSPLERAIRDRLHSYVSGQTTLQEFDHWFVQATAMVDQEGSQAEIDLVYEIFLRLAEYDHGDWTIDQVKGMFRSLADVGLSSVVAI